MNRLLTAISLGVLVFGVVYISVARSEETKNGLPSVNNMPLRMVLFYCSSCGESVKARKVAKVCRERWGAAVQLEEYDVDESERLGVLFLYEKHYRNTKAGPPKMFVGEECVTGAELSEAHLNDIVSRQLEGRKVTFVPDMAGATKWSSELMERINDMGIAAIVVAGLVDGVNPCAFTTIVFFLSMLAYLKKTRREMLLVGVGFAVGMFIAYFLLGLGLLGAVKTFSVSHGLSSGLACGVAILAFALAGLSLIDAVRYVRTGDTKQVTLGLPKKIKDRIHKVIRTGLTTRGLVVGSLSVGFLVSLLESLCTGQVYLPTIVFMTRAPGMQATAIGYLLLYNVMFIVPLLGILAMTYFGVRSETLGNMLRKRLALAKFAMAVLFAGLGTLVLLTV